MKYLIISLLMIPSAHALKRAPAPKLDNPDYKQFYLVNGKQAEAEEAILASLKGAESFRCTKVEASLSRSGNSIGLKNIKRKAD